MSHHLDTPLAAKTGQLLIDDLYVFPGEGSTVFVLDINSDVNGLHTEPGFHPEARYEIKIHVNRAEFEDLTYRVAFAEPDADGRQRLTLRSLTGDQARGDAGVGDLVLEGRTGETATDGDGVRLWAGHVKDSFYVDLSLLAIVNGAVANGTARRPVGLAPGPGEEQLRRQHRADIVLEVPHDEDPVAWHLHRRLGGHQARDRRGRLAAGQPGRAPDDVAHLLARRHRVHRSRQHPPPVAGLRRRGRAPGRPRLRRGGRHRDVGRARRVRAAVAKTLLPDVLPYVVGTPASFGFVTRNGRTLADNAPEAMMSLVVGAAVPGGLKPSVAEAQRSGQFPFLTPA